MKRIDVLLIALLVAACAACGDGNENSGTVKLPYYGNHDYVDNENGGTDTIYHKVGPFSLVNQDSNIVTNEDVEGKIYVADFFFTSCPTICPKMKTQMLRVYDSIQNEDDVMILSHTIDPEYDTVGLLKGFAKMLNAEAPKWHFLTGDKKDIYRLGQTSYMVTSIEDPAEPGGFIHSGAFLLVDKKGHIRGVYDGTDPVEVNGLIKDIAILQEEDVEK